MVGILNPKSDFPAAELCFQNPWSENRVLETKFAGG
jgi:hypothetical protein